MSGGGTWRLACAMITTAGLVMTPLLFFAAYTERWALATITAVIGSLAVVAGFAGIAYAIGSPLPLVPVAIGLSGYMAVSRR